MIIVVRINQYSQIYEENIWLWLVNSYNYNHLQLLLNYSIVKWA